MNTHPVYQVLLLSAAFGLILGLPTLPIQAEEGVWIEKVFGPEIDTGTYTI